MPRSLCKCMTTSLNSIQASILSIAIVVLSIIFDDCVSVNADTISIVDKGAIITKISRQCLISLFVFDNCISSCSFVAIAFWSYFLTSKNDFNATGCSGPRDSCTESTSIGLTFIILGVGFIPLSMDENSTIKSIKNYFNV